jgi:hypothetical protein
MIPPPVLFLVFNRPDTTAQVMEAIRRARPPLLYVAGDGPRVDRPGEAALCEQARSLAMAVDWPCQVRSLHRAENVGCRLAVSAAIDWFFENEEAGIILEDDCLPSPDFFPFCAELLDRFREDERVMAICGSCYADPSSSYPASYYFSYYADIWGWATWRRAWRMYDRDMSRWPAFKRQDGLTAISGERVWHRAYWTKYFDAVHALRLDTWDYQWVYSVIDQHGLACYPVRNLVSNLGFRPDATHTVANDGGAPNPVSRLPHAPLAFPLVHPQHVTRILELDREIDALRLSLRQPAEPRGSARLLRPARRLLRAVVNAVCRTVS